MHSKIIFNQRSIKKWKLGGVKNQRMLFSTEKGLHQLLTWNKSTTWKRIWVKTMVRFLANLMRNYWYFLFKEDWSDCDDAVSVNECLFCSKISRNLEKNMEHMTKVHNFFIPDIDYVTDLDGLLTYLGNLI